MSLFGLDESDNAIFGSVDSEIPGHIGARAGDFSSAGLADENFAVFDFLATKTFDAEALASIVVNILGGTASFDMLHLLFP